MNELKKILYVEDEPDIQAVARIALENLGGFTLALASSGQEALHTVSSFKPDLILLDVMMPDMDGPTTMEELKKMPESAHTPVIFVTAKVQPHEVAHLRSLGAMEVIAKPFDPMTISDTIKSAWRQAAH